MPYSAKKPCNQAGCNELVQGKTYCNKHTKEVKRHYDKNRQSSYARGYDNKWRKSRLIHLEASPLCVRCLSKGLTVAATVVDHIIPHKGDKELFNDPTNWQSLCKPCHDGWKQRIEKSGKEVGCDINGLPADSNHHWNR